MKRKQKRNRQDFDKCYRYCEQLADIAEKALLRCDRLSLQGTIDSKEIIDARWEAAKILDLARELVESVDVFFTSFDEGKVTMGIALICPKCGKSCAGITLHLDDLETFSCIECTEDFDASDVEELIAKTDRWLDVLSWVKRAPHDSE